MVLAYLMEKNQNTSTKFQINSKFKIICYLRFVICFFRFIRVRVLLTPIPKLMTLPLEL
jgi:hypothetical protein